LTEEREVFVCVLRAQLTGSQALDLKTSGHQTTPLQETDRSLYYGSRLIVYNPRASPRRSAEAVQLAILLPEMSAEEPQRKPVTYKYIQEPLSEQNQAERIHKQARTLKASPLLQCLHGT